MEVLWALSALSGRVILEANFRPHSEYERSKLVGLSDRIVEIYCSCPPALAAERYAERAASRGHHPAHVTPRLAPELQAEFDGPMGLGAVTKQAQRGVWITASEAHPTSQSSSCHT